MGGGIRGIEGGEEWLTIVDFRRGDDFLFSMRGRPDAEDFGREERRE